ncbi:DNA-3-methyladenine glycosylase [Candidatus Wolfebacteria bacterium]|nr:DNA-3-methyladenine glycosylase [Candidatus Wolfebacteria bacterium]
MGQEFFARDARTVARELLGKYLVRRYQGREAAYMITEVEAYVGPHDKASHAHRGRTKRTEVMFGKAGRFYVYLVYGMYWMLNIVTDADDYPSAVLIRGAVPVDIVKQKRGKKGKKEKSYSIVLQNNRITKAVLNGPGKLTCRLHIDGELNAQKVERATGLWVEDRGVRVPVKKILRLPRVGVAYAGEWAAKPYRYILKE